MNLQRLVCTLFMMTAMALAGCGGGGGGGSMPRMTETPTPTPDDGSMMDDDMMMGGGTGPRHFCMCDWPGSRERMFA